MNDLAPHILVVDDDDRLRELLRKFLSENGFLVEPAQDAADARVKLSTIAFDLIVLDLMMPGESGLDFAADRKARDETPILMLTAMGEAEDRIAGLERGADDYLCKPFEPRELLLRIHAILRRANRNARPRGGHALRFGPFVFDLFREELRCGDDVVRLTSVETALLKALAESAGRTLSREDLIDRTGASGGDRAVDVQITRLRRKIEDDPKIPQYLQTVRGKGYILRPD